MSSAPEGVVALWGEPHHDGSEDYTSPGPYVLGGHVELRLRVPSGVTADRVRLRSTPDAEPVMIDARVDDVRTDADATWWIVDLALHNPFTRYRFLLEGGTIGYAWLTEAGLSRRDVTDQSDFSMLAGEPAPGWLAGTVGYQVFIDRFASAADGGETPSWAIPTEWSTSPSSDPAVGTRQWYGGDLCGLEQRLDHLVRLGVDLIYLTPFFPARSSHRYDASSFDSVDPVLGGDDALASLVTAAHQRGIRVIGDITLNHTGDHHEWFRHARSHAGSDEAGFYMFDGDGGYVAWHDVESLPKLDHRSDVLASRLYRGPDSVIARYLRAPFELDGWRVDCANTTGRWADIDRTHRVANDTLSTITAERPDGWLLAEHCFDASDDLRGPGWHGVMAYQWFTRPLWAWLRGAVGYSMMSQIEVPALDGPMVVESMRQLASNVPWTARAASMTMLDSHDSARFRTVVGGDVRRHEVGLAALLTMPGVPTLFAGSEVGVEGESMDTCRVPFPWDESDWDTELFDIARQLIELRRSSGALHRGSLRWLAASADSITYLRELDHERVVVHLNRADTAEAALDLSAIGASLGRSVETLFGEAGRVDDGVLILPGSAGASLLRC